MRGEDASSLRFIQSTVAPTAFTTSAHLARSRFTVALNCSSVS